MILFFLSAATAFAAATTVGAERCKLCHRDIYLSWAKTPHAKEAAPPLEERCLACHATGEKKLLAVQCEACHGPGSEYSLPEIMIDPEKAAMAGLVRPSIAVCERCHENAERGHRGRLEMPEPNDWGRWIHAMKDP